MPPLSILLERPSVGRAVRLDPNRPDYDAIMAAHDQAVAAGDPGYLDPGTGLFVLTATYLRERGHCCDQGCRHCPYLDVGERDVR
jgi:hypothetical protein